jgi:hypothetical protein
MGTALERVEREIAALQAEAVWNPDVDPGRLPAHVRLYVDGLEEIALEAAERVDMREADTSSSGDGSVGGRRSGALPPGSQRYRIVQHLAGLGLLSDEGQITDEISEATRIPLNSVSTRMSELLRDGWVAERGEYQSKTRYAASDRAKEKFAGGLSAV